MLICRSCGSSLPDTASFCGICGVTVTPIYPAIPVTLRQSDTPTDPALPVIPSVSLLERSMSRAKPPPVLNGIRIFISYAQRDQNLLDRLEDHLSDLKYRGLITTWTAQEINAGEEVIQQIDIHLNTAHIILLLISASFLASEYCYSREMKLAVRRHRLGDADVIPVLLRPVVFTGAPFAVLKPLPTNGKPVVNWRNRDSAFVDIAMGIERVVQKHLAPSVLPPQAQPPMARSEGLPRAYGPPLSRRRRTSPILVGLGILFIAGLAVLLTKYPVFALFLGVVVGSLVLLAGILLALRTLVKSVQSRATQKRREEEIRLLTDLFLRELEETERQEQRAYYEKALTAYERALRQNNTDATAYRGKGNALVGLERFDEALVAFTQAVALMPLPLTYVHMGDVLATLRRYDEAVASYRQALTLDASYASAYTGMSEAFLQLGRAQEAEQAYEQAKQLDGDN